MAMKVLTKIEMRVCVCMCLDDISHRPVMRRKRVRMTSREKPPTDAVTTTRT